MTNIGAIDLHKLRYFYLVVTLGSFSKAAAELAVTQSAVSQAITALEKTLGHPLLCRQNRSFSVTPLGTRLLSHAKKLFNLTQLMEKEINEELSDSGSLAIGADELAINTLVPSLLESFLQKQTKTEFHLTCRLPDDLLQLLSSGDLDLVFTYGLPQARQNTIVEKILQEEKLALMSAHKSNWHQLFVSKTFSHLLSELKLPQSTTIILEGTESSVAQLARISGGAALGPISLARAYDLQVERVLDRHSVTLRLLHHEENYCRPLMRRLIEEITFP